MGWPPAAPAAMFPLNPRLRSSAGVALEDLPEVVGPVDRREARAWVVQEQQGTELGRRAATEGIGGARNMGATFLPRTADGCVVAGAEEWVEVGSRRWVRAAVAGAPLADTAEVGRLDPGQVRFEADPAEILPSAERRAAEQDGRRVDRRIECGVGQRARPRLLVGDAVEVVVRRDATADLDQERLVGIEAAPVVAVLLVVVADRRVDALAMDVGVAAQLEVADLIRVRHVVRVRRPRHARVLA